MKKKYLLALFAFVLLTPILTAQNCSTLAITNTVDASVCGEGSVTLGATASGTGDGVVWYDAATAGNVVGSGASFQTPILNSTTSYWATEALYTGVPIVGDAETVFTTGTSNSISGVGSTVTFAIRNNNSGAVTITDIDNYMPANTTREHELWYHATDLTGPPSAINAVNGWVLATPAQTSTSSSVDGLSNIFNNTSISIPGNTTYRFALVMSANVSGSSTFYYWGNTTTPAAPNNFSGSGVDLLVGDNKLGGTQNVGYSGTSTSPTANNPRAFYGKIYFESITIQCESTPREEVVATVNNAGDVVVNSLPYTDTDDTANFANNYSGAPGTDCGTTDDYLDGNDVVYEYTATADFIMNAELANIVDGETSLYIYDSCADIGASCLAGTVNATAGDHSVDFSVVNGQTYYILISSTSNTNTFPYTFNLDGYLCANYPAPTTSVAAPDFIDGQALLDLPVSGTNLTWYSDAALTNIIPDDTLMVDNTTYYVTQTFDTCESPALLITPNEVLCSVLSVSSSQASAVCGEGSVTLEAQGAEAVVNTSIWWFDAATGGTVIGKGDIFETPVISQTTSFWATEVVTEGSLLTGQGEDNPTGTLSTSTNGGVVLDVTQQMTLVDAEVFSTSSAGGLLEVELRDINNGNATVASTTMTMPAGGSSTAPIAVTVPLNFNISPGEYRLVKVSGPTFKYESGSFPDPLGSFGSVTGGATTTGTSTLNYVFYNLTVGNEEAICESSPRAEVIAAVNNVADLVTTNPLPYVNTDSTGNYANNYTGVPGKDCDAAGNYLDGNDVVYEYTPDGDKVVKIGLSNITGSDAGIFIYDNCNEIGDTCLAGAANIGSSSDFAIDEFTVYQSETYYIVVSGNGDASSIDYTLTIEEAIVNCNDYVAGPEVDDLEFFNPGETLGDLDITGGNLIFYSDLSGTTVLPGTTSAVDGTIYYVSQTLNGCLSGIVPVEVKEIVCSNLDVISTTGDSIPCVGSGTLQATVSGSGTDTYWYENQTGGNPVGFGNTFSTPEISSTTSYWVSEAITTGTTVPGVGLADWTYTGSSSASATYRRGLYFNATESFTINTVDVYDASSTGGTANIELYDTDTDVMLTSMVVNLPGGGSSAAPVQVTLNLNFNVPSAGNYKLVANDSPALKYEYDLSYAYLQLPLAIGSVGEILEGGYSYTSGTNEYEYTYDYYYYFFYNWTITEGEVICESPREEVIATIDTNGDIQVTTLPYNDSNNNTSNYGNPYEGVPGTGCNTTENYLNGNDVVYKFTAPNTELVDILMSDLTGFYASVFVYDNCGELLNSCLAGAVAGPSDDDFGMEDFSVTAGEDYYIVVSSWLSPTVGYTLDIIPFDCDNLAIPVGASPQTFNTNDTLADLEVDPTKAGATLSWYNNATATTAIPETTVLVDGTTYYVTQTFSGCESDPLAITVDERDCTSLAIVSTTDDTVNCQGEMTLTATASGTGDDIYWYDTATGGNPIAFGNNFTTPVLTNTTSYWVSETSVDGATVPGVGVTDWTYTGSSSASATYRRGLYFNATESFTINTVDVYDASSTGGTANIELYDTDTDVMLTSTVVNLPGGGSSAAPVQVTLNLNFNVPSAGNYKLVANDSPALKYEYDFSNTYLQLPLAIGSVGEIIEGGYSYTSGVNEYEYTYDYYYYFFYNWTITEGEVICESPRTEVLATVNQTGDVQVDSTDLPYNTSDSTSVYGDNFDGDPGSSCPGTDYLGGNEVVYQYTADAIDDDILQIELTNVTNPNTGMYIYTSCGEVGTNCLEGATNEGTSSMITISDYYINAGETIFIVISSESNTVNYTLDIYGFDCNNVAGPIVDDTTPYFVQPDTLDDIDLEESENSSGIVWYSDAGATMPIPNNTPLVDGTTYYVTQTILGCESMPIAITPEEFNCAGMSVAGNDALICAPGGEVILTAQASGTGSEIYWYDAATGGNIVNLGDTYEVDVTQTTSFWASEVFIQGAAPMAGLGLTTYTYGIGSALLTTPKGLEFTAISTFNIMDVEVFSTAPGGTMDVSLLDNTGGVITTKNVTIPSGTTASPTPVTLSLNFTVPGPGTYQLVAIETSGDVSMMYEYDFSNGVGLPMNLGGVGEIINGVSNTSTYDYYYYYFYNWTIGTGDVICESPREEVIVTVNDQPTVVPTGDAVQKFCQGATVSDLLSSGADIQWYNSDTSNSPLAINEVLIDGGVYYASQTIDACESDNRLEVTVDVKDVADLPIASINQSFVAGETVEDLDVQGDNLIWYTSTDGLIFTVIDPSQINLLDQGVYYVSQTPNGLCESDKLAITVHRVLGLDNPLFAGLNYYPNPMRNQVSVENSSIIERVELYSMLGQKVIDQKSNQRKVNLNVERLAAGPYFIKVTVDGKSAMIKVVKE